MNIDPGLVVVIVAVLIFYLRLIVLQRQRAHQPVPKSASRPGKKGKSQVIGASPPPTMISPNRRDRLIGAAGAVVILLGVLLYLSILPFPLAQTYWWVPTALGIVAFSWAFKV